MEERRQSWRAGSRSEVEPGDGEESGSYRSNWLGEPSEATTPDPGEPERELPLEEVAGERPSKTLAPEEALLEPEPALHGDWEPDITMRWGPGPRPG